MLCSAHTGDVDSIEKHCKLRGVQYYLTLANDGLRLEFPSLEPFVPKHEATFVVAQDLDAVTALGNENVEMPAVQVLASGENESTETVETFAHIGGLAEEHDLHR